MDVLSDVLRVLRLSGAVLFQADFSAPWDVSSPSSSALAQELMPNAARLVLFHVITRGQCWAEIDGEPRLRLDAGHVVVFPYGDPHVMGAGGSHRVSVTDLLPAPPWQEQPSIQHGGKGEATHIVCGFLHCDDAFFNPLLGTLPRMFAVDTTEGGRAPWLDFVVAQSSPRAGGAQPGAEALMTRLAELMLLDVLRRYMAQRPSDPAGLLAALNDEHVAAALELIHDAPAEAWTVETLGRRVGLSRSGLAARFKSLLGMPPMQYITRLRLQKASQLLRDTDDSLAEIASRVGYESEAAFNRAFKRFVGQPPAAWRKATVASAEAAGA